MEQDITNRDEMEELIDKLIERVIHFAYDCCLQGDTRQQAFNKVKGKWRNPDAVN